MKRRGGSGSLRWN